MRLFIVILTISLLMGLPDFVGKPFHAVAHSEESDLFLLRILLIDDERHELVLEMVDGEKDLSEPIIYILKSVPESLKKGDLIRIWGHIEKKTTTDSEGGERRAAEGLNQTGGDQIRQISIIRGTIAGSSYRTGSDPTGVRKRLKLRIGPHQPPPGGAGRVQP